MTIEAERLTVKRLGRAVLREVSVRIGEGEVVSVIGPNGAGKSTLMSALLGLLPVAGGQVRLDGLPIESIKRRQVARRIACVPQIHEGYLGFTVREVVESGRYAHLDPLDPLSADDRAAVTSAAAAAGIQLLMDRTVDTLSGGERQKVWIAAALAQGSPTLFLDEPTNALDPAHQAELIRIMRRFAGREGRVRDSPGGPSEAQARASGPSEPQAPLGGPSESRAPPSGSCPAAAPPDPSLALRAPKGPPPEDRERPHTLLVISHDLNLPLAIGGRVLALLDGTVAFDEPVEALLDTRRLERLFGTRFTLHRDVESGQASIHIRV